MTSTRSDVAQMTESGSIAKILVPHDGTEASDKALDKAVELARSLGSEVIILNVIDDRFVPPSTTLAFLSNKTPLEDAKNQVIKFLKQGAESMLKDRIEKLKSQGINMRFLLAVGSPSEEIARIAQNEGVGLIIIGRRRLGLKEKIKTLGSIVRGVSERAPCPVMIVP